MAKATVYYLHVTSDLLIPKRNYQASSIGKYNFNV